MHEIRYNLNIAHWVRHAFYHSKRCTPFSWGTKLSYAFHDNGVTYMNPAGRELFVGVLEDPASSIIKESERKKVQLLKVVRNFVMRNFTIPSTEPVLLGLWNWEDWTSLTCDTYRGKEICVKKWHGNLEVKKSNEKDSRNLECIIKTH
jgi:hypothetical protein